MAITVFEGKWFSGEEQKVFINSEMVGESDETKKSAQTKEQESSLSSYSDFPADHRETFTS